MLSYHIKTEKKHMKQLLIPALCLFFATCLLVFLPTDAEADIYEDTLRLHILAASDSEEDQATKLDVRDYILRTYGERLSAADSVADAGRRADELLPDIERDVETFLSGRGVTYGAHVTLTEETYGTRVYDGFSLPAGTYLSLQVTLGEGEGHNWWCVMFPPMCLGLATEEAESDDALLFYSDEEVRLIEGGEYKIKFKLLEAVSAAFSRAEGRKSK